MQRPLAPLVVLFVVIVALPAPTDAGTTGLIQPGVDVNGNCTLNFVYDGTGPLAGRVFIGTAAHCFTLGTVVSTATHSNFGEVVYVHNAGATATDYEFIEVYPEFHDFVSAEVKGHPGTPTAVAPTGSTARADLIRFSGSGIVFENTQPTQEERIGLLWTHSAHEWLAYGTVTPGDSGGPVIHDDGRALGIVTQLSTSFACCDDPTLVVGAQGPSVEGLIGKAAANGFPVTLRTV